MYISRELDVSEIPLKRMYNDRIRKVNLDPLLSLCVHSVTLTKHLNFSIALPAK